MILSGKIGSNIASEIGTMRVTEQIDALDIMGVNSANYLIMPKVLGLVTIMPFLVIITMATALFGGWAVCFTGILDPDTFIYFVISSISSYYGYTVKGGSVEVGKASTDAVVMSNIIILVSDVILTKLLLM